MDELFNVQVTSVGRKAQQLSKAPAAVPGPDPAGYSCSAGSDLPPLHVLVAEDNPVNQKVICSILQRRGATAEVAANGSEAYDLYRRRPFDLILMDVQMPETDGLEATRLIRRDETESPPHCGRTPASCRRN